VGHRHDAGHEDGVAHEPGEPWRCVAANSAAAAAAASNAITA
jgi:hypothetical protein